jgi:apolipoprotein N-acyltransferase
MKKTKSKTAPVKTLSMPAQLSLTAVSALLCTAAFPDIDLWPLAWISLVPFLFVLSTASRGRSFLLGCLFGSLHMISLAYWIFNALYIYTAVGFLVSLLFLLLVIGVFLGLYYGLFALMAARLMQSVFPFYVKAPLIAAAWVCIEYLRAHLFSGVPWDLFGHSQYRWLSLIQIADTTGVYGISFLLAFANCSIYLALASLRNARAAALRITPPIILLTIAILYGVFRLNRIDTVSALQQEKIAIVQLSILQDERWKNESQDQQLAQYLEKTKDAFSQGAKLILWPENATQTYFQELLPKELLAVLAKNDGALVVGAPRYINALGGYTFYNSAFLLNGAGIANVHDKMHLLPFGEYFPLGFIDILKLEYAGPRQYSEGGTFTIFNTSAGKLGMLICFEITFPELARGFVQKGADILVNISNDAWFGKTSAHYQHFSMAVFRAVEFRRPVLRSANTGISGCIDPAGRIVDRIEPFKEGILLCKPGTEQGETFYCRFGDVFAWICMAMLALSFFYRKH